MVGIVQESIYLRFQARHVPASPLGLVSQPCCSHHQKPEFSSQEHLTKPNLNALQLLRPLYHFVQRFQFRSRSAGTPVDRPRCSNHDDISSCRYRPCGLSFPTRSSWVYLNPNVFPSIEKNVPRPNRHGALSHNHGPPACHAILAERVSVFSLITQRLGLTWSTGDASPDVTSIARDLYLFHASLISS